MKLDVISKHRAAIYGLSILWIVVFHGSAIDKVDYSFGHSALLPLKTLIGIGNVGVDVFLFLSGVCLCFSFSKSQDIARFMRRRFERLVPAALLVYTGYWAYKYLVSSFAPADFLSRMTLMRFWMTGDQTMWFVSLILVLYLAFPLVYSFIHSPRAKSPGLRALALIAFVYAFDVLLWQVNPELYDMVEIAVTRVPVFLFGCWFGKLVLEGKQVSFAWAVLLVALAVLFYAIMYFKLLHGPAKRFAYGVGGVSVCYSMALAFGLFDRLSARPVHRFLSWVGGFSLELYLTHIMLNQVLRSMPYYQKGDLTQYAVMAVIAFVMAWAVSKAISLAKRKVHSGTAPAT